MTNTLDILTDTLTNITMTELYIYVDVFIFMYIDYTQALAYASLGSIDKAKTLLKKSLHCVFTSTGAFNNLQLIWKHQL